eukprot:2196132-Alexandrium_andersonii.AAC.1
MHNAARGVYFCYQSELALSLCSHDQGPRVRERHDGGSNDSGRKDSATATNPGPANPRSATP